MRFHMTHMTQPVSSGRNIFFFTALAYFISFRFIHPKQIDSGWGGGDTEKIYTGNISLT